MSYALYRATGPLMIRPGRLLGRFSSYDRAMRERDGDVLVQLAEAGGYYLQVHHVIVGPGLAGPATEHRVSTAIGVDPDAGRVPTQADLLEAAAWLAEMRSRHWPGTGLADTPTRPLIPTFPSSPSPDSLLFTTTNRSCPFLTAIASFTVRPSPGPLHPLFLLADMCISGGYCFRHVVDGEDPPRFLGLLHSAGPARGV